MGKKILHFLGEPPLTLYEIYTLEVSMDMNKVKFRLEEAQLKYIVVWDPIDLERPWSFRTC